jgi:hypothetical protein
VRIISSPQYNLRSRDRSMVFIVADGAGQFRILRVKSVIGNRRMRTAVVRVRLAAEVKNDSERLSRLV